MLSEVSIYASYRRLINVGDGKLRRVQSGSVKRNVLATRFSDEWIKGVASLKRDIVIEATKNASIGDVCVVFIKEASLDPSVEPQEPRVLYKDTMFINSLAAD